MTEDIIPPVGCGQASSVSPADVHLDHLCQEWAIGSDAEAKLLMPEIERALWFKSVPLESLSAAEQAEIMASRPPMQERPAGIKLATGGTYYPEPGLQGSLRRAGH